MQNISKPALFALRLPVPPVVTQQSLIAAMSAARTEAIRERTAADQLATRAAADLESALLGAESVS